MKEKNRLSKILAGAGVASRRACELLIQNGRVTVDGQVALVPQTMVTGEERIEVDGAPIAAKPALRYLLLHKPAGYVCSAKRGVHAKIVLDLFPEESDRLFTVGRLDKDTQGLLILTNDGHFANRVIHPSSNLTKEYLVKTDQEVTHEHLQAISSGTQVEGIFVKPKKVTKVRRGTLKVAVSEGKKHEVRLLLQAAGLRVKELTRIRIGGLHLGTLPIGQWRDLTEKEKRVIFEG